MRDFAGRGVLTLGQLDSAAMPAQLERTNMKIQNGLAVVTVTAIAAMFITQAKAQYRPAGDDGIAASPKVRAMLNERLRSTTSISVVVDTASSQAPADQGIAASPKVRQMLAERKAGQAAAQETAVVSSQPRTGDDGIAASPKVRAQLNERSSREAQIAPLK